MTLPIEAIADALPSPADAPVAWGAGDVVTLTYASADVYARRVSDDVETLREIAGHVVAESWVNATAPLAVHLRYVAVPVVAAPFAPPRSANAPAHAHVPASPSRRR